MSMRKPGGVIFSIRRAKKEPRINMAPMIDCVFLLLIFFMVATTFASIPGIRVKLPPLGSPPHGGTRQFIVRIMNPQGAALEGTMILAGAGHDEIIGFREMFNHFISAPEALKAALIIQSERDVSHGQIVRVIDIAKQAGIDKIRFAPAARRD